MRPLALLLPLSLLVAFSGCAITATRPVQDMSNTASAIRAAREVQADTRAPELYRQANEWFFRARQEYKLKNFKEAKSYATKARKFAEEAEFEAMNSGANRIAAPPDPFAESAVSGTGTDKREPPKESPAMDGAEPAEEPPNKGVFVESYEENEQFRKKLELEKAARPNTAPPSQVIIQQFPTTTTPTVPTPAPSTR